MAVRIRLPLFSVPYYFLYPNKATRALPNKSQVQFTLSLTPIWNTPHKCSLVLLHLVTEVGFEPTPRRDSRIIIIGKALRIQGSDFWPIALLSEISLGNISVTKSQLRAESLVRQSLVPLSSRQFESFKIIGFKLWSNCLSSTEDVGRSLNMFIRLLRPSTTFIFLFRFLVFFNSSQFSAQRAPES